MITMVKLSSLPTAAEIRDQDMKDLDYRREHERTKFANDVAVKVLRYRTEHGLSQRELGRIVGMPQPHIARLESGDHEPSLSTLARLAAALGLDFSVDVKPSGLKLRYAPRERKRALRAFLGLHRPSKALAAPVAGQYPPPPGHPRYPANTYRATRRGHLAEAV